MEPVDTRPGPAPAFANETILLVDPYLPRRRELAARLEARGIRVLTASDGQVALDILEASPSHGLPELIAAESAMPRLDGPGLMAALRATPAYAAIPVVLFSGPASGPPGPKTGVELASLEGVIESRLRIQRSLRRLSEARASFGSTT